MTDPHRTPYVPPVARLESDHSAKAPGFPWLAAMACGLSAWIFLSQGLNGHFDDLVEQAHKGVGYFALFVATTMAVVMVSVLLLDGVLLLALMVSVGRRGKQRRTRRILFWLNVLASDALLALVVLNWITAA